ncbi:MAG: CRISPR-associated endoribonuclease Cas6 [Paludibacteraceae bacterium]|nr:CRISPR-associated endoribonuclease Cas6 [Paludibacteraceae bacterium]
MRFLLSLNIDNRHHGRRLPLNYQYELSAATYHILANANEGFSEWLHENGFRLENGKQFKLFTFSRLQPEKFRILKQSNQMELVSDKVGWQISFLPERSTQQFIEGLFQKRVFDVGNRQSTVRFQVDSIQMLPPLHFTDTMTFQALSPISVSKKLEDGRDYYPHSAEEFAKESWIKERLFQNLTDKYEAFYGKSYEGKHFFDMMTLSEPKSSLVTIKAGTPQETKVRGFLCKLALHCPAELMRIAYESGLGEGNSQGFGCLGGMEKSFI